jgi:hypothetical protein
MRVILDENVPNPLAGWLAGHEVTTVQKEGWSGIRNGELIAKIDRLFELFITADKNLRYQQNLRNRHIAILELPTNRWPRLVPLQDAIIHEISGIQPADYRIVSA